MTSRRKFLTTTATLAMASTVPALSKPKNNKKSLVHHVYFWLKNPTSKEDLNKLIEGISSLKKIETLRMVKIVGNKIILHSIYLEKVDSHVHNMGGESDFSRRRVSPITSSERHFRLPTSANSSLNVYR